MRPPHLVATGRGAYVQSHADGDSATLVVVFVMSPQWPGSIGCSGDGSTPVA